MSNKTPPKIRAQVRLVKGARLYHEIRGSGPPVLFISGATGDAGHFDAVADVLADAHTVVTYDRRGNSRSPRPDSWTSTSLDEQADDADALIASLDFDSVAVYGNSGGALVALALLLRHPTRVKTAILHEPPMLSVVSSSDAVMAAIGEQVKRGYATAGPAGGVEAFVRFASGSAFEHIPRAVYERMLGNGDTLFGMELGTFETFRPSDAVLKAVSTPVAILAGADSPPFFREAAEWLAPRLRTEVATIAGGHTPQFDRPLELAETIRSCLRRGEGALR